MLKVSQNDIYEEHENIAYLTRRFQKIVREHGQLMKKENSRKSANAIDLFHKCGKLEHFITKSTIEYCRSGGGILYQIVHYTRRSL